MAIEENIKALILSRYRSIRDFVSHTELSYSTVDSILRRGICNSSLSSIIKLCNALDISADELSKGNILPIDKNIHNKTNMTEIIEIIEYTRRNIHNYDKLTIDGHIVSNKELEILLESLDFAISIIKKHREMTN